MKLQVIVPMVLAVLSPTFASAQVVDAMLPGLGAPAPQGQVEEGKPLPANAAVAPAQRPAFGGQARAPAVKTQTPIDVRVVVSRLDHPWGLAFIDDGTVLVTEKRGSMRVVDVRAGAITSTVDGVPKVVFGQDAGLLDVVTDPKFHANRLIYFSYVEPRGKGESGVVVAKAKLDNTAGPGQPPRYMLQAVETLIRVEPGIVNQKHFGARLLFDRDGFLYVSLGERFFSPYRDEAQSLYSWLGKILRITTDGKPAPGNPFDVDQDAENHYRPEIWSYGHRNPQALAISPVTGALWSAEHGPQGGDEINLIKRGANYGWPLVAYGTNYDGSPINGGRTQLEGTEQPRYYWEAAIAPGGMTFCSGEQIPEWKNNLFVASLAGQHVARLVIDGDKVVGEERLLQDQHQRIRDIKQGPDGALWVITDDDAGRLIRLSSKAASGVKRSD